MIDIAIKISSTNLIENSNLENELCKVFKIYCTGKYTQNNQSIITCLCKLPEPNDTLNPKNLIKSRIEKIIKNTGINPANTSIAIGLFSQPTNVHFKSISQQTNGLR